MAVSQVFYFLLAASYASALYDCDFEAGQCGWADGSSDYRIGWTRQSMGTPAQGTGPPTDASNSPTGHFMNVHVKVSKLDAQLTLTSPEMKNVVTSPNCKMHFSYSIYAPYQTYCINKQGDAACNGYAAYKDEMCNGDAATIQWTKSACAKMCGFYCGQLRVDVSNARFRRGSVIYEKDFSDDQLWTHVTVAIPAASTGSSMWITIEAQTGWDANSYIAVDNIKFTDCNFQTTTLPTMTPTTTTTTPTTIVDPDNISTDMYDCSFDTSLCGWTDQSQASWTWIRASSRDPSRGTGPTVDSAGAPAGGFSLMTVDQVGKIETAKLVSPTINQFKSSPRCHLKFQYNSYAPAHYHCNNIKGDQYCSGFGNDLETQCVAYKSWYMANCAKVCGFNCANLKVYVTDNLSNLGQPVFLVRTPEDTHWYPVDLDISIYTGADFWVVFEGQSGKDSPAYIAVDEIEFIDCDFNATTIKAPTTATTTTIPITTIATTAMPTKTITTTTPTTATTTISTTTAPTTTPATTATAEMKVTPLTTTKTTAKSMTTIISTTTDPKVISAGLNKLTCPSDYTIYLAVGELSVSTTWMKPAVTGVNDVLAKCVSCPPTTQKLHAGNHTITYNYRNDVTNQSLSCSFEVVVVKSEGTAVCKEEIRLGTDQGKFTATCKLQALRANITIELPVGVHRLEINRGSGSCLQTIEVYDSKPWLRRVALQARYPATCGTLSPVAYSVLKAFLKPHYTKLASSCPECQLPVQSTAEIDCESNILTVLWVTGITQPIQEAKLASGVEAKIVNRLSYIQKYYLNNGRFLDATLINQLNPLVAPIRDGNGLDVRPIVISSCPSSTMVYDTASDSCFFANN